MIPYEFRIHGLVLLMCGIALILAGCASRVAINDDLDFMLRDLEKKAYVVGQFRADFHKIRQSHVFCREMNVKGKLTFQKENKFQLLLSGDINVEILSDGEFVTIVHDGRDEEFYHVRGDRDRSRFSDPLMTIINTITGGDLSKFSNVSQIRSDNLLRMEIQPGIAPEFERIRDVSVDFSESGAIRKVVINFKDGSRDTTVFDSWSMLTQDDASITKMNAKLEKIAKRIPSGILPGSTRLESYVENPQDDEPDRPLKKPIEKSVRDELPNIPFQSLE